MKTDGWIDLQINGYAGVDFNAPGLTVEAVRSVTELAVSLGHQMAKMMRLLAERVGLSTEELRAVGRDNPLNLISRT